MYFAASPSSVRVASVPLQYPLFTKPHLFVHLALVALYTFAHTGDI
jgi:hypothetical protein